MRFFCDCDSDSDSQSEVSSTIARLHFASKCDFLQFQDVKKEKSRVSQSSEFIRFIHTERFSCDCVYKSLREIRIISNFSLRIRNRRHMRSPHLHYAIFLRLRKSQKKIALCKWGSSKRMTGQRRGREWPYVTSCAEFKIPCWILNLVVWNL